MARTIHGRWEASQRGFGILRTSQPAKQSRSYIAETNEARRPLIPLEKEPKYIIIVQVHMVTTDKPDEDGKIIYETSENIQKLEIGME